MKDLVNFDENAVFIDGGSFDGNTIKEFAEFQNNRFDSVYAFEPEKTNYLHMRLEDFDDRVRFFNYGLSDSYRQCFFSSEGSVSKIVDDGEKGQSITCVSLDSFVNDNIPSSKKITWIKMDIEGAELDALHGAQNIIIEDKPNLTICVYHKPNDIWSIPQYIHSLCPEYKLSIRHHSNRMSETVLYARI